MISVDNAQLIIASLLLNNNERVAEVTGGDYEATKRQLTRLRKKFPKLFPKLRPAA